MIKFYKLGTAKVIIHTNAKQLWEATSQNDHRKPFNILHTEKGL